MKLGVILVLWSSVAAAAPDVCATVKALAQPEDAARDPRVTLDAKDDAAPTSVKFCPTKDTCKTFPLKGLRGSPPDPPRAYLNKPGTLGVVRWLANDEKGWHDSLRLFNLTSNKQVKDLTSWQNGGFVTLTANRFIVDQKVFDPDGKVVGKMDARSAVEAVSPDESLIAFANRSNGNVVLYDLATGKQRGKVSTKIADPKAEPSSFEARFSTDGKTLFLVADAVVVAIEVATLKAGAKQNCPQ